MRRNSTTQARAIVARSRKLEKVIHNNPNTKDRQRLTKIVCTLGPASNTLPMIEDLIRTGMNIARMNFSHGSHESHLEVIQNVRQAVANTGLPCSILLDTKGPEIRTGLLEGGAPVKLTAGQSLQLQCGRDMKTFMGTSQSIAVDYPNLPRVVEPGSLIKFDDGLIVTTVTSVEGDTVHVRVENHAELGQRKGVNLPGAVVDLPAVMPKDKDDLLFGVKHGVDFIAASFARRAEDIQKIREVMGEEGKGIQIIAKIENQEGLDQFDSILREADGIMVARGDLGVEIPLPKVCTAQKMMIRKCNVASKPVITATQMLESMVNNPRPTRAEATDVANAVLDGTDCVMLSGETAKGSYPVKAVEVMARICNTTERALDREGHFRAMTHLTKPPFSRVEALTSSAVRTIRLLPSVRAIAVLTESGSTSRLASKYRPGVPILALVTHDEQTRQAIISHGVYAIKNTTDVNDESHYTKSAALATQHLLNAGWVKAGDDLLLISGSISGQIGSTNTIKIMTVQ